MWTIFMVSSVQMIGLAITPAVKQITLAFPQYPLSRIQTVISISGIVMPCISLLSAAVIRRGLVTKKAVIICGLTVLGITGLLSQVLHSRLWHIALLAGLAGFASGCYLSTTISLLMDKYEAGERRVISGFQSVFVNTGAVLVGLFGGLLAAWQWYGGYLVMLVGIPMGIVAFFTLPKEQRKKARHTDVQPKKTKIKSDIVYYAVIIGVFMTTYAVCNSNLAVHLSESGVQNTAIIGTLASFQMVGGALFGFVFGRFSAKFKDYTLVIAFVLLSVGLTILNVFASSLVMAFVGVFLAGVSISMLGPQCIYSASHYVDEHSSAVASALINGIAPGVGSFLSPVIFTNLTTAIAGSSTNFRYQFVAVTALGFGVILAVLTAVRANREKEKNREVLDNAMQP